METQLPGGHDPAFAAYSDKKEREEPSSSTTEKEVPAREREQSSPEEHEYLKGIKLILVLSSLVVASFLMLLDMIIIATAIPRIIDQFHSLSDVGWYGSVYQLTSASLQPLAGKLYTHLNSKWVYLAFFATFELGSLICGLATASKMLIVGRAIAGMGGAGMMNGAFTILSACAPAKQQPALLGILLPISQLGLALGPVVGGALTEYVSWRWCFYINLPIGGAVAIILLLINIPDQIIKEKLSFFKLLTILDLIGFTLFLPASIMFFLALQYGGDQYGWGSSTVIGLFVGAGLTLIIFLLWEWRTGDEAMIPFSMLAKRTVWTSCVTRAFYMGDIVIVSYYLPIYFQTVKGVSPIRSGYYILPVVLIQMVFAGVSSGAVSKFGYYLPWAVASGAVMAIGGGLYSLLGPSTTTAQWIGYQIVAGCGNGLGTTTPILALQSTLPIDETSIALAILIFFQNFSGAAFLTFAEVIFTNSLKTLIPQDAPGVNAEAVIAAGATGLRGILSDGQISGVLKAYSASIDHTFYLAIGASIGCMTFACGMGWVDIRKKKDVEPTV